MKQEDPTKRSWIMGRVRSKDTKPELVVRRALHAEGFRFRVHPREIAGNPDLLLPKYRTVVFVNGCFWHGHGCKRSRMPVNNREYWREKINRNVERDRRVVHELEEFGFRVETIWECQLRDDTERLIRHLAASRAGCESELES